MATADRERAAAMASSPMRLVLERSANAWSERAKLLDRLATDFGRRAADARVNIPKGGA